MAARHFKGIKPPDGYQHLRDYCRVNFVRYSMVYSRINQARVPFIRIAGKYFIPIDTNPLQFEMQHYGQRTRRA